MPWYGHNFEDAIVLSERLVKDDVYSSIHIQELELHVRDTKRGREEITREIPNVAEESLVDLDERGIVRIGAHVKAGVILVGKITPKGETELSPEEKLLTAIFGEKAKDVKDSSRVGGQPAGLRRADARRPGRGRDGDRRAAAPDRLVVGGGCVAAGRAASRARLRARAGDRLRPAEAAVHQWRTARHRDGRDRAARRAQRVGGNARAASSDGGLPEIRREGAGGARARAAADRAGSAYREARGRRRGESVRRGKGRAQERSEGDREEPRQGQAGRGARSDGTPRARGPVRREVRGRRGCRGRRAAGGSGAVAGRQVPLARRPHGRAVRVRCHRRLDLHDEAVAPRGRQDPRPFHWPVLAGDAAAARR